jgi:hypothetical protein
MVHRIGRVAFALCLAATIAAACGGVFQRPPAAVAKAKDFHRSDPKTIAATGRPQLLEFFEPT